MLRRLLAQFGLTALIMALGAGAAFADTAPANALSPSDPGATVVTNGTNAVVDTTNTTTTTIGPVAGGPGSSDTTGTPPSATPPTNGTPTGTNLNGGGTGSGNSAAPSSDLTTGPTAGISGSSTGPSATNPTPPDAGAIPAADIQNQFVSSFARVVYMSGLTPVEPILVASAATALGHHTQPPPPSAPVGLLNQLHILLISTLVPATRFAQGATIAAAASHAGLQVAVILVLAALALIRFSVPVNTHTARLRRSGFLGAARSDVAGALLSFATPREMSSIGAYAPG